MATEVKRFYSLDVLRGLASLGVVFSHWSSFSYIRGELPATFSANSQPLYGLFAPLYEAGNLAVDLFFCLSGFIFFVLYSERVTRGEVSARQFCILRLSRLYPLHFATLLFVAIGQAIMLRLTQSCFHCQSNDTYHFILNLLFASSWGLEKDHSFNGPVWSVSVEILLYVTFFVFCRLRRPSMGTILIMSAVGIALWPIYSPIAHGIFMFYLGGIVCLLYQRTKAVLRPTRLLALVVALWMVPVLLARIPAIASAHRFAPAAGMYMRLVFPITIYVLALCEAQRGTLGKRLAIIGDISYSTYLIHFPLQVALAIVATLLGISFDVFQSPYALFGFFAMLLVLAYLSHRFFEVPAQNFIRNRWLRSRPRIAVQAG